MNNRASRGQIFRRRTTRRKTFPVRERFPPPGWRRFWQDLTASSSGCLNWRRRTILSQRAPVSRTILITRAIDPLAKLGRLTMRSPGLSSMVAETMVGISGAEEALPARYQGATTVFRNTTLLCRHTAIVSSLVPRTAWDRPRDRAFGEGGAGFRGYRQPTSWDSPKTRQDYGMHRMERPKDLSMKAPHFDGSDAACWISRVDYYFDHLGMLDAERLHYVVMLFRQPAVEWIFNYRENPVVT